MLLSFAVMYLAMFSMIDGWGDLRNNVNTFYMALTMVAPMGSIMLATMAGMYPSKKLNLALHMGMAALFVVGFAGTRAQAFVDDRQFIDSMVPHHSGAILMCREADLRDAELIRLCQEIRDAQRREIQQMDEIRKRLARS
jgi:uncharacterized protein (DUF305 family)